MHPESRKYRGESGIWEISFENLCVPRPSFRGLSLLFRDLGRHPAGGIGAGSHD